MESIQENKKHEAERMKRELIYAIERFIRDKGEVEGKLFDAKVAKECLKKEGNSEEYKSLKKSLGKSKADEMIYKKHKQDVTIKVFNDDYPDVITILTKHIKENGGYY